MEHLSVYSAANSFCQIQQSVPWGDLLIVIRYLSKISQVSSYLQVSIILNSRDFVVVVGGIILQENNVVRNIAF